MRDIKQVFCLLFLLSFLSFLLLRLLFGTIVRTNSCKIQFLSSCFHSIPYYSVDRLPRLYLILSGHFWYYSSHFPLWDYKEKVKLTASSLPDLSWQNEMQGDHTICSQMWLWIYTPPHYPLPPPPQKKKKKEKRKESLVFAIEIFKRQALFSLFFNLFLVLW